MKLEISNITQPISSDLQDFEALYRKTLSADYDVLNEVLRYIGSKDGKRLRPILVLLAARLCQSVSDKSIQTAVAMEILHTASLVHDDVVDASPLRRGQESVNARWNNKVAVLVGDYLFAQVLQLMSEIRNTRILAILSSMAQGLVQGELMQLHAKQSMWITEAQYMDIIAHKTAYLFAACAEAGAVSACASPKQISALRDFGYYLGLCFQMKDDLIDYSDNDLVGKPTMSDIADGKVTLPLIAALSRAPQHEADDLKAAIEEALQSEIKNQKSEIINLQSLTSFVLRYDGVGYAMQRIREQRDKAEQALSSFRDSTTKSALLNLLHYSISRLY